VTLSFFLREILVKRRGNITLQSNFLTSYYCEEMIDGSLTVGGMTWTHFINPTRKDVVPLVNKYNLHEIIKQDFKDCFFIETA
jgi:hypothetical protein